MLRLSDFDYYLPKELIAQYPSEERDSAKLLVLDRKKGLIEHRIFRDICEYLKKDDLLVLNDTKVLASRIKGKRSSGGKVEVLLLRRKNGLTFEALIKPSRLKIGEKIYFNGGSIKGTIESKDAISFEAQGPEAIYNLGAMPLPPYIKREAEPLDKVYYQTVYANKEGAVASPTAGLHFTEGLLKKIESRGTSLAYLTLHVGLGTFKPVSVDDITKHRMEEEYLEIPQATSHLLERAREKQGRIFAVGTTSLRALEASSTGRTKGFTDIFIYPGYSFRITDCLITNFHLPRTTLYMLISAFAGGDLIKKAYQEAIEKKYRFYSYGDAMLII